MCQSPKVYPQWLAGPSPLLQSPLPLGLGAPSAPAATCRVVMVAKDMLPVPQGVSALCTRLPNRALGPMTRLQPWGRCASESGKQSVMFIDSAEVLLPAADNSRSVLMKNHRAGVFGMAAAAFSSLSIRLLVEKPVCVMNASRLGLVPGQVCLDPSDFHDFVDLREDSTPEISVVETDRGSPLEGALNGMTNILAVGDNMHTCLQALDRLKQGSDLASLSSLGRARHRPMGSDSMICGDSPTCTGSARGGTAPPVCRDDCDFVRDQILRVPPNGGLHLKAVGWRVVLGGDIASVFQTSWGVWQQGWAPRKMWAVVDKMGPVCIRCTAYRAMVLLPPTEMG